MSNPEIFHGPLPPSDVRRLADETFGDMIKFVVDIERRIICAGGGMHSDEEAVLLEGGSNQNDLWGANYYPDIPGEDRFEYNSMINLRPHLGNTHQNILLEDIRTRVRELAAYFFESNRE